MHSHIRRIRRACVAAAAGVALSTVAVSGASASAAAPGAVQVVSAAAPHAAPSPGTQLWVSRYDGPASSNNVAASVAVSPTGKAVFVTGASHEAGGLTVAYETIAYNATTGHQLWAKRYSAGFNTVSFANSVAVSPDGGTVFVTGESTPGYVTIAYNAATGAQLWLKHGPTGGNVAYSVAVSPDGATVFVTGETFGSIPTGNDYTTIAYNAATGRQLWVKRYSGPQRAGTDQALSLAVSPNGGTVFVTGESESGNSVATNNYDYATVAYNAATGAQLWAKRYNGPASGDDIAHSVAVSPTGKTVIVTGESHGAAAQELGYATIAYNAATGAQLWVKRYDGPASTTSQGRSVAISPTGGTVFVTGSFSRAFGGYATIAYKATTGAQQWVKTYNADDPVGAYSVAVSPTGATVYVTGEAAWPTTGPGYETIAYNAATGAQQWAKSYKGPGPNGGGTAYSIAVSPTSGTVFVTGDSVSVTGQFNDYATVAYAG